MLNYSKTQRGNLSFSLAEFENPDKCFYPIYAWVWNDEIKEQTIKSQIDEMCLASIKSFYVLAIPPDFRPDSMVTSLSPDYLSDEFMRLVKFAADYAKSKGMMMWIYDEAGWPSGGAGGLVVRKNPKLARKHLARRHIQLKAGESYSASQDSIASFVDKTRIFSGYSAPQEITVTEYFRRIESSYFTDPSEKAANESFIEITHEKYKNVLSRYFGDMIPLMFTDEPHTGIPSFPKKIEKAFKQKYGYDILDYLPAIYSENSTDEKDVIAKIDYGKLCGEILNEDGLKIQKEWCNENGLFFGGHFSNDHLPQSCNLEGHTNIVNALRQFDIPGIDVIWRQIYPGKATPGANFFPRFASSAARQNGTNLALSESFSVYGTGLSHDVMRYVINHQLVRGINLFNFMLISYGRKGYLAFAQRPSFGAENPGYNSLGLFNKYTARASYLQTVGKSVVDTAIYLPMCDFLAGGETCAKAVEEFIKLGNCLEESGIQFDVIEDYGISDSEITDAGLKVGEALYKHIYIPKNKYMPQNVKEKVSRFSSKARPVCKSSIGFSALRISKRKLENNNAIYYLFNESVSKQKACLEFFESKKCYELDLECGDVYFADSQTLGEQTKINVELESGESKAFLFTDEDVKAKENPYSKKYSKEIRLTEFTARAVSDFVLDKEGCHKRIINGGFAPVELGSWKSWLGNDFSGEVMYRTIVCLPEPVASDAMLSIGRLCYYANVYLNGRHVQTVTMSPMKAIIPAELFAEGENILEISVANTAANQFVLSNADSFFEEKEVGCYHSTAKEFEKDFVDGGLYGPISLWFT